MMAGSCVGMGTLLGTFQAAGARLLNHDLLKPKAAAEKPDPSSPLLASTQERRLSVFKVCSLESVLTSDPAVNYGRAKLLHS